MKSYVARETMTAREREDYEQQREMFHLQAAHSVKIKELELKLAKTELKWQQVYKIPTLIIKLPVLLVLSIGFVTAMARGVEPSDRFWELFK